jgi:hypothetical protein
MTWQTNWPQITNRHNFYTTSVIQYLSSTSTTAKLYDSSSPQQKNLTSNMSCIMQHSIHVPQLAEHIRQNNPWIEATFISIDWDTKQRNITLLSNRTRTLFYSAITTFSRRAHWNNASVQHLPTYSVGSGRLKKQSFSGNSMKLWNATMLGDSLGLHMDMEALSLPHPAPFITHIVS